MLRYMLDTDICIFVLKNRPQTLKGKFDRLAEQIAISSITFAELCYGAEKSQRRDENFQVLREFVARLYVLSFSPKAAEHYGHIRADPERSGKPIGSNDMLIGAHARSEGLTLVTDNAREFRRISGLHVENWV